MRLCPASDWHPVQDVLHLVPRVPWIDSRFPVILQDYWNRRTMDLVSSVIITNLFKKKKKNHHAVITASLKVPCRWRTCTVLTQLIQHGDMFDITREDMSPLNPFETWIWSQLFADNSDTS